MIIAKNYLNSYSVKVNGSGLVTVRNRASLRKILPVVPVHNLVFAQGMKPVQGADTRSQLDRAVRQAGPRTVDRAGRQAGAGPRADMDVVQPEAGPRVGKGALQTGAGSEVDAEAVLRVGAEAVE